jgi:hypothetical protein
VSTLREVGRWALVVGLCALEVWIMLTAFGIRPHFGLMAIMRSALELVGL